MRSLSEHPRVGGAACRLSLLNKKSCLLAPRQTDIQYVGYSWSPRDFVATPAGVIYEPLCNEEQGLQHVMVAVVHFYCGFRIVETEMFVQHFYLNDFSQSLIEN